MKINSTNSGGVEKIHYELGREIIVKEKLQNSSLLMSHVMHQ